MKCILPHRIIKTVSFFGLMVLICLSCAGRKYAANVSDGIEKSNSIIFLNYKVKKRADGKIEIEHLNHLVREGRLKKRFDGAGQEGDLEVVQLDKDHRLLSRMLIKNPLRKTLEFADESKGLQTKTLNLDEATFSVRMQLHPETKQISIKPFSEDKSLIQTKINQE
ncbi:hypothetical protein [Tamlana crocina]|uniref:Lipoprotein n=1 Tax=Tamlana crocina TaxID=393006 RepID=A0ABX1DBY1_9FLAO|nr:hypothetical protein [Tamlana crocina]NJX14797.1 hypothetical protein [Tamlana crocina]